MKLTLNEIFQMKFLKRSRFSAGFSWMINFTDICMAMNANHVCISRGEEGLSHNALNILASFNEKNAFNSFYICFRLGPSVYVNILIQVFHHWTIAYFFGAVKQHKQNISACLQICFRLQRSFFRHHFFFQGSLLLVHFALEAV